MKDVTNPDAPHGEIIKALFKFQQACPAIKKESKAGTGNFQYKYGSLPHIIEVIKPHLKAAELVFTQTMGINGEGGQAMFTTLYHTKSGEEFYSAMILPEVEFKGMNSVQSAGAVITYFRRYALMSILGLVTDDDDTDAQGNTSSKSPTKKRSADDGPKTDAKPWLNPKVKGEPSPTWQQAVKYLADGGKVEDIKKKYRIGKANEEKLLNDALTFDDLPFDRKEAEQAGAGGDSVNTDFDNQGSGAEFNDDDNPNNY